MIMAGSGIRMSLAGTSGAFITDGSTVPVGGVCRPSLLSLALTVEVGVRVGAARSCETSSETEIQGSEAVEGLSVDPFHRRRRSVIVGIDAANPSNEGSECADPRHGIQIRSREWIVD